MKNALGLTSLRKRRGVVLVLVLWLIVLLFVISVSLSYEMHVGGRMTTYGRKQLQALALARAGVAQAVLDLKNDRLMAAADPLYNNDTLLDVWAMVDNKTEIKMGGGTFTARVFDEDAKIDLNTLNPANMSALTYLLEHYCNVGEEEAREMTQAFMDYVDQDTHVMDQVDQNERDYYYDWAYKRFGKDLPEGFEFRPKNEGLLSVDELLEIPGFTWEVLYGDPETTPTDPIDRSEMDRPPSALVDYVAVYGSGRVNVNTASLPVLEAMFHAALGGGEGSSGAEQMANTLDKFRQDQLKLSKGGGRGIMDPEQLQQAGIDPAVLQMLSTMFRIGQSSYFFTIVSRGEFEGVRKTLKMSCYLEVHGYPLGNEHETRRSRRDDSASGILKTNPDFKIDPEVRVARISEL